MYQTYLQAATNAHYWEKDFGLTEVVVMIQAAIQNEQYQNEL